MEQILIAREAAVKFFKQFEMIILPLLKFGLGLFLFTQINSIGHAHEAFAPFADAFSPNLLVVLFAVLFTVMPMNMSWIFIILTITVQFSSNIEVAVAVFIFLMFIFLFYARMAPRESILVLFTIIAFRLNIPYVIPLIIGLYFPVTAIIPVTVGVFVNAQIPLLDGLMAPAPTIGAGEGIADLLTELPTAFYEVYTALMSSLGATQTWLFTAVIFAMVIILVHFISKQAIDFAKEISIALGVVVIIFGFIMLSIITTETISIGSVLLGSLLSGLLVGLVRFFDGVLDYSRAESVQFEDDNNFYHVRIIPKVIMTKSQRVVKRIRPNTDDDEPDDDPPLPPPNPRLRTMTREMHDDDHTAPLPRIPIMDNFDKDE
jgi:hypothetical protein